MKTSQLARSGLLALQLTSSGCRAGGGGSDQSDTEDSSDEDSESGAVGDFGSSDLPSTNCSNGVLDPGEQCDDGNDVDLDGCNVDCEVTAQLRWEEFYSGPVNGVNQAEAAAFDAAGNLFVVGTVDPAETMNDDDIWVRKYDAVGTELWTRTFDGSVLSRTETGEGVALTSDQGIVIVGIEFGMLGFDGRDVRLIRLDADGQVVWDTVYASDFGLSDIARDVAVGPGDRVHVVGSLDESADASRAWVGVFGPDGEFEDEVFLDVGDGDTDVFSALALHPEGGLMAAGSATPEPESDLDAWIVRLDDQLEVVWEVLVDGAANERDRATSVAVLPGGDIVVGGSLKDELFDDAWFARYDSAGVEVWSRTRDGAANNLDFVNAVAVDTAGNIVVGGLERNDPEESTHTSPFLLKLGPDGEPIWELSGDDPLPASQLIFGLAIGTDDCIAVTGWREIAVNESYDAWVRVQAP